MDILTSYAVLSQPFFTMAASYLGSAEVIDLLSHFACYFAIQNCLCVFTNVCHIGLICL